MPFTAIKVDEHTKEIEGGGDYRKINPLGYLPTLLLDDGTLLIEGPAIAQYISDQVPLKNLAPPYGAIERTKLQSWLNFCSSEMHKGGFSPLFYEGMPEEGKEIFRRRLTALALGVLGPALAIVAIILAGAGRRLATIFWGLALVVYFAPLAAFAIGVAIYGF